MAIEDFIEALAKNAGAFDVHLDAEEVERLGDYYRIVMSWNARLHLVAPCAPAEFATRHVLESLAALPFLSKNAHVLDIGSGAGLPVIPCLGARPDLRATLIESSQRKAVFLREALRVVRASGRAQVIAKRFEEVSAPEADAVTCRALDRFVELFEEIVEWSPPAATLLFFGGPSLQEQIEKARLGYQAMLIPESERRFLFIIKRQIPDSKQEAR